MNTCPYFCLNKTDLGYCKTTVCINPKYNCISVTKWLEKADYVQVVRCKDCKWYEEENHNCLDEMGFARIWESTDYCSFGERKDDE